METWSVSTGTVDFVVGVDKKLWVGSGLFKNFKSFFGTQGAVFGSKSFDYTDWIALPDDAAGYSFTLVGWKPFLSEEHMCSFDIPFNNLLGKHAQTLQH